MSINEQALPKSWQVDFLGAIADVTSSKRVHQHDYQTEGIPFFRGKEITILSKGQPLTDLVFISDAKYRSLEKAYGAPKEGDILITAVGTIGSIYMVIGNEPFYFKDGNLIWLRNISNSVLNRFLAYYLKSSIAQKAISGQSSGSSQSAFTIVKAKKVLINLPPLPEQQKIAEILSTVDAKIENIEKQIKETEQLKKGMMQRLLTQGIGHTEFKDSPLGRIPKSWEVVKQSEVATFYNGRAYKLKEWEKEGIPVIRLQNLTGTGKEYYYSTLKLPEHQYCYKGDLLYMWSATFGPVWWNGDKAIYHYHIWKIVNEPKLDKVFHYYLLSDVTRRMKNESHGSTMLHVTKGGMEKLLIQLPPLDEQKQIAEILSEIERKLVAISKKREYLETQKKGLMQQLLTGQIRVKTASA